MRFDKPLYTEDELAGVLGIKPRSLRTERQAGRIGFKRVAGRIMYRPADAERWLDKGEEKRVLQLMGERIKNLKRAGAAEEEWGKLLGRLKSKSFADKLKGLFR